MPHVSSKKLNEKVYKKIFSQLADVVAKTKTDQSVSFLSSLLTETEQLMLSKRVAAAIMFSEGYSQYAVEKTLSVSPSTAARMYKMYDSGCFDGVLRVLKRQKETNEHFWESLEVLLRLGMPSMGKDRWKHLK